MYHGLKLKSTQSNIMKFDFTALGQELEDNAVLWGGFGQPLTINAGLVTGDTVNLESGCLEFAAKLLDALYRLQGRINEARLEANQEPIEIIAREVEDANGDVAIVYSLKAQIQPLSALDSVLDPSTV